MKAAILAGGMTCRAVYGWDARYMDGGPVREYEAHEEYDAVWTLGIDWRRGMLVSGGDCRINCWDLGTGAPHMHAHFAYHYADCDTHAVPRLDTCIHYHYWCCECVV